MYMVKLEQISLVQPVHSYECILSGKVTIIDCLEPDMAPAGYRYHAAVEATMSPGQSVSALRNCTERSRGISPVKHVSWKE